MLINYNNRIMLNKIFYWIFIILIKLILISTILCSTTTLAQEQQSSTSPATITTTLKGFTVDLFRNSLKSFTQNPLFVQSSNRPSQFNNDDLVRKNYRRKQRRKQRQKPLPPLPPLTTTTTQSSQLNNGRSFYDSKEAFSFPNDDDDDDDESDNQQPQPPQRQPKRQRYSGNLNELVGKLNYIMDTVHKTFEQMEKLDLNVQLIQKDMEIIKNNFKKSSSSNDGHFTSSLPYIEQNYPSILQKMYNIHEQTYQVCKDAVVLPKADGHSNCPTMQAVCTMVKHQRSSNNNNKHRTNSRPKGNVEVVVPPPGSSQRHRQPKVEEDMIRNNNDEEEEEDSEEEVQAMKEILGRVANWTLDQYVSRMHRNVAEELNIFNFNINEKMQRLDEKFNKIDMVLRSNDQISGSVLDIRDQVYEDHDTLKKVWKKIEKQPEFEQLDSLKPEEIVRKNRTPDLKCPYIDNEVINNQMNQTNIRMKTLFEEYFEKIFHYLNSSLPTVKPFGKTFNTNDTPLTSSNDFVTIDAETIDQSQQTHSTPISETRHKTILNEQTETEQIEIDIKHTNHPNFEPFQLTKEIKSKCSDKVNISFPRSCDDLKKHGSTCNGVYMIVHEDLHNIGSYVKNVYCDMEHPDEGWMVILRRGKFNSAKYRLDFDVNMARYRQGFGDMHRGEFWIGLDFIQQVTDYKPHLLQIDLMDNENNFISLVYDGFVMKNFYFYVKSIRKDSLVSNNPDWDLYKLASILLEHNRTRFLTMDHIIRLPPIEQRRYLDCAQQYRSGWWYRPSYDKNLSCNSLNKFQLFAPIMEWDSENDGQHQHQYNNHYNQHNYHNNKDEKKHLYAHWSNWLKEDGETHRELRYIMMKIRSE